MLLPSLVAERSCRARVGAPLLTVFALTWISACVGCGTRPAAEAPRRELADRLERETVALVAIVNADGEEAEAGRLVPYCAGTWVGPREILTAAHCLEDGRQAPGSPVKFSQRGEYVLGFVSSYWTGKTVRVNPGFDLALVRADVAPPGHAVARVSAYAVAPGDRVEVVGHPSYHVWSYAEGYVAAYRPEERNAHGDAMPTLQLQVPISGGNSGGGAFDASGGLVGVCSYFESTMPGSSFFVAREAVAAFLANAR